MKNNKENLKEIITTRIKYFQTQQGLTQEKLAYQSGVSKGCLSGILNKSQEPTIYTITKLCAGLNISVSDFFNFPEMEEYKNLL